MMSLFFNKKKQNHVVSSSLDVQTSVIAFSSNIVGVLQSNSAIRLDGTVKGDVRSLIRVIIGENSVITGDIYAESIDVNGTVKGNLHAIQRIALKSGCDIVGDIYCKDLVSEESCKLASICHTNLSKEEHKVDWDSFKIDELPPRTEPADMSIYNIDVSDLEQMNIVEEEAR